VDNKTVDNKTVDNKTVDNKTVGNKTVGNKTVGNKSVGQQKRTNEDKCGGGRKSIRFGGRQSCYYNSKAGPKSKPWPAVERPHLRLRRPVFSLYCGFPKSIERPAGAKGDLPYRTRP
jgi:hypothetical protein